MRDQDKKKDDLNKNEGEGSTSAARRYEKDLEEFKKEKNVEELAEEAAKELGDEDIEGTDEGKDKKVA